MRALGATALAAVAATLVLVAGSVARGDAGSARTTVLDRTYACAVFVRGGTYLIDARAHAGTRLHGAWARLPYASVRSGVFSGGAGNQVAWVTSGKPVATTMIDQDEDAFDVKTFGTVGIRKDGCRRSSARVPLTPVGLHGGVAPPLGNAYECFTPKHVLIRVRTVFSGSGGLVAGQSFNTTHQPVREAKLAVRTVTGKPLVYADTTERGRARLFTAKGCTPS